jgi:hypothetical protein
MKSVTTIRLLDKDRDTHRFLVEFDDGSDVIVKAIKGNVVSGMVRNRQHSQYWEIKRDEIAVVKHALKRFITINS